LTCVTPSGKVDPDAGEHEGLREPSSLSLAETEYETAAPLALVASTSLSAGRVRDGAVFEGGKAFTVRVKFAWLVNSEPVTPPLIEWVML
jgi:hypothetical protein